MSIRRETGQPRITGALPNSPASQAGIAGGTIIESIDGVSTKDKPLADCVSMIRGAAGTKIQLGLADAKQGTHTVELTRQKILIDQ